MPISFRRSFQLRPERKARWLYLLFASLLATVAPAAWPGAPAAHVHSRTIAVDSMGTGATAEALRQRIVAQLERHPGLQLAASPAQADMTLHGSASIWPTG